jgi:hypothetical protein
MNVAGEFNGLEATGVLLRSGVAIGASFPVSAGLTGAGACVESSLNTAVCDPPCSGEIAEEETGPEIGTEDALWAGGPLCIESRFTAGV